MSDPSTSAGTIAPGSDALKMIKAPEEIFGAFGLWKAE
jgi:hypothetical protein